MPQDQDDRTDPKTTSRPTEDEQQPTAGAVSRMLANPRRTRRA
ncbi:hypothetical protein [Modestobacter sp. L9-4]|jgi:hypothetical protein|nr:hypothetical protein [Modestobacter sp. L9-4]